MKEAIGAYWRRGAPAAVLALAVAAGAQAQKGADAPTPSVRQLMQEVEEHQKQLEQVRENYTYTELDTTEDVDAAGRVKKTETVESDDFFVNGHLIARTVARDGKPLAGHDLEKENERVTKLVEKAEKTPQGKPLEGISIGVGPLLNIMDVSNPQRVKFRGRPTYEFDFVGRKNAKTHGMTEDLSKKLKGTLWIDEADLQVAQLEVSLDGNFRVAGGLVATIQKGSSFRFEQAPVDAGDKDAGSGVLWLPTGAEGTIAARMLLLEGIRQRFSERDYDFKRFSVETEQGKGAKAVAAAKK